jgi:hypothetical protein
MVGTLSQGAVPGLLGEFSLARRSGILHFMRGEERRSVSLQLGHIVNAHTNVEQDRLGEILVRHGTLSRSDLETALKIAEEEHKRLGVVLRELGILDEQRLDDALAAHVREVLGKVFSWSDGSYTFDEEPVGGGPLRSLPTAEVILEAARRLEDADVVRYALGDIDRILVVTSDPRRRSQQLALNATDCHVLSLVDGSLSARRIIQSVSLAPEDARTSLLGLLAVGLLEWRPAPPRVPAVAPPVVPAVIFDVAPEVVTAPTPHVEPPPLLDPMDEALLAEDMLRKAERLMAGGMFWDAIQLLQGSLPRIRGRVVRDKAQILLASAYLKNPKWGHRGEEVLQTVIKESPQNGEAHFILGTLYEERGLKSRAEAMYRKVLEVRPGHREASVRLNALTSAPSSPLLKKLFGKS